MLCDHCKERKATVHSVSIIEGEKHEQYLCSVCAQGISYTLPSMLDVLGVYYGGGVKMVENCECGYTLQMCQKSGVLGCPICYTTFREQLDPVIRRVQGGKTHHVGRSMNDEKTCTHFRDEENSAKKANEVERLRAELQTAIAAEEFELAAQLRDKIRAMEAEGMKNEK